MYLLQDEPERAGRLGRLSLAALCALGLSGGGLWAAQALPQRPRVKTVVELVTVVETRQPEPEPEPESKPPQPEPKPKPAPRRAVVRTRSTEPEPEPVPVPPQPEQAVAPAQPVRLGLSLSSLVSGSTGPGFVTGDPVAGRVGGSAPQSGRQAPPPEASTDSAKVRTQAALSARITPTYPEPARAEGIEGVVVLALTIGPDGRVESASVLSGLGHGLDEAALAASRRTRWTPATLDGKPIRSRRRFNVRFTLDS